MSAADFDSWQETVYLLRSGGLSAWASKSITRRI
jgi:PHD/YefM family antitoxin component YafN of YafNO toxin-antitoxin module